MARAKPRRGLGRSGGGGGGGGGSPAGLGSSLNSTQSTRNGALGQPSVISTRSPPRRLSLSMRVHISGLSYLPSTTVVGTVRFIGNTQFASGTWIGVELDQPLGKNDGSVQGQSYFHCSMLHGIFVREAHVQPAPAIATKIAPAGQMGTKTPHALPDAAAATAAERDREGLGAISISTSDSMSEASGASTSEAPGSSSHKRRSASMLKLKLSQLMALLNQQLEIVEELEAEEKLAAAAAGKGGVISKKTAELCDEVVSISKRELQLIKSFQQRWK